MSEINNPAVPELVIVTVTGALLVLIGVGGNVIWVGETVMAGCAPVATPPFTATRVGKGFEVATWTYADTAPAAVGENVTEKARLPLAPIVAGSGGALAIVNCPLSDEIAV